MHTSRDERYIAALAAEKDAEIERLKQQWQLEREAHEQTRHEDAERFREAIRQRDHLARCNDDLRAETKQLRQRIASLRERTKSMGLKMPH